MKRLDSKTVAQSRKPLVLKRETLRRLEAGELQQAAGGNSLFWTCGCVTQKQQNGGAI